VHARARIPEPTTSSRRSAAEYVLTAPLFRPSSPRRGGPSGVPRPEWPLFFDPWGDLGEGPAEIRPGSAPRSLAWSFESMGPRCSISPLSFVDGQYSLWQPALNGWINNALESPKPAVARKCAMPPQQKGQITKVYAPKGLLPASTAAKHPPQPLSSTAALAYASSPLEDLVMEVERQANQLIRGFRRLANARIRLRPGASAAPQSSFAGVAADNENAGPEKPRPLLVTKELRRWI